MAMVTGQMGIHAEEKDLVLALDPGRSKTGFAFIKTDGTLLVSGIFPSEERGKFFDEVFGEGLLFRKLSCWITEGSLESLADFSVERIIFIVIGNGTGSKEFKSYVLERSAENEHGIFFVDETNTTLEARKLYWKIHRPGLLTRLIPEGMRVPPRIIDDLAAWCVGLRGLKEYRDIIGNKL